MKKLILLTVLVSFSTIVAAEGLPALGATLAAADEAASEHSDAYREGRKALDEGRWADAVRRFSEVADAGGKDVDAALYWKAYAHYKAGEKTAALASIKALVEGHPESRWRDDARSLRAEIRQSDDGDAELSPEDELKVLALNSLMHANSERALALLEGFLEGDHSPELKNRALFVLSQNPSPKARELLLATARGGRDRELQLAALRFLGMAGGEAADELEKIYGSTSDKEVKMAILHAYLLGQDAAKVRRVYDTEKDPELRGAAVHQLGMMGARDELRGLYRSETSAEVRGQVLHALFIAGDAAGLMEIYGQESDPELKEQAIHSLGLAHRDEAGERLVEIYRKESNVELKRAALHALFLSQDAGRLIALARAETDPELRREAIRQISMIGSDEATEFMMEILNQ